jgi:hypothetical protein
LGSLESLGLVVWPKAQMMCGKWRENLKIDGKGKNSNNTNITTQTNNIKD